MLNKFSAFFVFLIIILFTLGCGASFDGESGFEPTEVLELDDAFEFETTIEKDEVLGVDMRVPHKSGYRIVGASFDPGILLLVHYVEYADEGPRIQYMFQAVADGTTDILLKMQPISGGESEIYKRVTVNVGDKGGILF